MNEFDTCFDRLIGHEGGYSFNPADPGGETMYGITARTARRHGYGGDMRALPRETAKQIARVEYWAACRADELPDYLRFDVFDACYNSGASQCIRWLQRAVGAADDGIFGPATMAAVQASDCLAGARFNGYRLQTLTDLGNWSAFGKGWARRLASNLQQLREPNGPAIA